MRVVFRVATFVLAFALLLQPATAAACAPEAPAAHDCCPAQSSASGSQTAPTAAQPRQAMPCCQVTPREPEPRTTLFNDRESLRAPALAPVAARVPTEPAPVDVTPIDTSPPHASPASLQSLYCVFLL